MKKVSAHRNALKAGNTEAVKRDLKDYKPPSVYAPLLYLVADVLDNAVRGEDIYLTLGMTRDRTQLMLCVKWDGDPMYILGDDIKDLADRATSLL